MSKVIYTHRKDEEDAEKINLLEYPERRQSNKILPSALFAPAVNIYSYRNAFIGLACAVLKDCRATVRNETASAARADNKNTQGLMDAL
jgi:hypothetical protein